MMLHESTNYLSCPIKYKYHEINKLFIKKLLYYIQVHYSVKVNMDALNNIHILFRMNS